jgi:UDP-N-acetylglucosamine acyltransferase
MAIHRTAIIDRRAEIDSTVEVGAYAIIEGPAQIGPGTKIYPHAYIAGWTQIGRECQIHPFTAVGHVPQDLKYVGVRSYCRIGDHTTLREGFSVHRGTDPESVTEIGRNCLLMANAHVAHNCKLGDEIVMTNGVLLAGYVTIGDGAVLGGGAVVHQFARIGERTMVAGLARVACDLPPFLMAALNNECVGVNQVGLRRAGLTRDEISEIKQAYRALYRGPRTFRAAVEELTDSLSTPAGRRLLDFLLAPSKRGFMGPPQRGTARVADCEAV